jgi:tryptophan synthase beta subunit
LPDQCIACGRWLNAIGLFHSSATTWCAWQALRRVEGIASGKHAARFADPRLGRPEADGTHTYVLQDRTDNRRHTFALSRADYAAVGPEHAWLRTWDGLNTRMPPMTRRWKPSSSWRAQKVSCRRSNLPTPSPR